MKRDITVASGGTDNHIVLLDVFSSVGLTGRQAESVLLDGGVVTNRNSIPDDPNGAWYASGIRMGTPALTTLGMGTAEMDEVADIIASLLKAAEPTTTKSGAPVEGQVHPRRVRIRRCRQRCAELLSRFRLYPQVDLPVLVTSRITEVEVRRNLARLLDGSALSNARVQFSQDLDAFALVGLDPTTCNEAARIAETTSCRSLDAIHLASALRAGAATTVLTFDVRQAQVARSLGLAVAGS
jgi:predicted nucleic acid-binding protein